MAIRWLVPGITYCLPCVDDSCTLVQCGGWIVGKRWCGMGRWEKENGGGREMGKGRVVVSGEGKDGSGMMRDVRWCDEGCEVVW